MEDGNMQEQVNGNLSEDKSCMPSSKQEEETVKKKYGGIMPKKPPLISKDHERAFFDSADWALGKQGAGKPKGPLEALRPKLQVHMLSAEQKEKPRLSIDRREKSRFGTDRGEKSRKSVDRPLRESNGPYQNEKARNSIDRFGGMIRSVGLCNIDCFKPTATAI